MSSLCYDIFVSYSHRDAKRVLPVANEFRRKGLRVFLDAWEYNSGQTSSGGLPATLARSVSLSGAALFFAPRNNSQSMWIELELRLLKMRSSNDPTFGLGYVRCGGDLNPTLTDIDAWVMFDLPGGHATQIEHLCRQVMARMHLSASHASQPELPFLYSNFKNEGRLLFVEISSLGDILYVQELVDECEESAWSWFCSDRTTRKVGAMEWDSVAGRLIKDRCLALVSGEISASYDHSSAKDTRELSDLGAVSFADDILCFDVHHKKEVEHESCSSHEILEHLVEHFEYDACHRSLNIRMEALVIQPPQGDL